VSSKGFTSELERALARPDVGELREIVAEYFRADQASRSRAPNADDLVVDPWIYDSSDPDRSLALVALAIEDYDDPMFLGLMAAGPLEDILMFDPEGHGTTASPSDEIFSRVMDEGAKNPRFRWMLGGIYTNHLRPDQQKRFDALVERSVDCDLPPRPQS
jgi:hypothetical protein